MSAELWILAATAVLAVVAISAAVIAVSAARRLAVPAKTGSPVPPGPQSHELVVVEQTTPNPSAALVPRVVQGRVIVPPTEQQVVAAAMGRSGVRLSILAHGVAHALREESRDRISAMMRREYRRRRRERLQAGRRAIRGAQPTSPSDQWLGS